MTTTISNKNKSISVLISNAEEKSQIQHKEIDTNQSTAEPEQSVSVLMLEAERISEYMALNEGFLSERRELELQEELDAITKMIEDAQSKQSTINRGKEKFIGRQLTLTESESEYEQTLKMVKQHMQEKIGKEREQNLDMF